MSKKLLATHLIVFFLGLTIGSFLVGSQTQTLSNASPAPSTYTQSATVSGVLAEKAIVKRVIDGDTIELSDGRNLRYIGIDTPETVDPNRPVGCFGKEASGKNKELVLGKEVELEKDVSDTDRFGRLLRYVYIMIDGERRMVNELLVREGYANASSYPPDVKYQEFLRSAEGIARETNVGMWGPCLSGSPDLLPSGTLGGANMDTQTQVQGVTDASCQIKGNVSASGDKIYHLPGCGSYEKTVIDETVGERYFCTEQDAEAAGWRKAKNC